MVCGGEVSLIGLDGNGGFELNKLSICNFIFCLLMSVIYFSVCMYFVMWYRNVVVGFLGVQLSVRLVII